ncbi:MAG: hypothetical protein KIT11_05625 [Fimbriimonadaceae bacterium]|nr:hypothetical protein [Fimbriimonadaceae bacterium]QYK56627.1 MAG: hypothetical protein KF733_03890 [Fimbriimonadaceae bacterium]
MSEKGVVLATVLAAILVGIARFPAGKQGAPPHAAALEKPAPPLIRTMSVYSDRYEGRKTASGDRYDKCGVTVASNEWPLGTKLVLSLGGRSLTVRVNDRMSKSLSASRLGARSRVDASHEVWRRLTNGARPGLRKVSVEVAR